MQGFSLIYLPLFLLIFASVAAWPVAGHAGEDSLAYPQPSSVSPDPGNPTPPDPPENPAFPVDAHLDAYAKFGSDRRLGGAEVFLPVSWNGQTLTFADLRFVADDADSREINAGFGLRHVADDGSFIVGGYGFLDRRRTPSGNFYTQSTAGAEFLTENWELRGNVYAPLSGEKTVSEDTLSEGVTLSGTGLVANLATETVTEKPMFGADLEVGAKAGFLKDTWFDETWVYGGVYHFDAANVQSMEGTRFRVETAPLEWLRLGAEAQHDTIRGETGFLEARIRIPLYSSRQTKARSPQPEGIYKRLDSRIARDVDVVTQTTTQRREETEPVLNAATGTAQKIYVVDNTATPGGDGSAERPFTTLAAAQGAAGAHEIIYVKAGDGTDTGMDSGITLSAPGQKLIGSGVNLVFDAQTMDIPGFAGLARGTVIAPATTAPLVSNSAGDGVSITAASVEVAGLSVNGASNNGISVYNADDVVVRDLTATGNANDGLNIEASGAGVSVEGVSVRNVTATGNRNGIRLYAQTNASLAAKVEHTATTGNTWHGIIVYDDSAAGSVDADLGGGSQGSEGLNTLTGNTLEDLAVDIDGASLWAQNNWWGQAGGPTSSEVYKGAPLQNGLVMNWTFDDGTARDRSGYGYDGTLVNGPTPSSGALDFNNPADNESVQGVDVNESDTGDKLSVFLRMRPDSLIAKQTPIMKWDYAGNAQNSWGVRATNADASNLFFFVAGNGDGGNNYFSTTNANLTAGTWNQIGFVYDGAGATNADRLKTYKDAALLSGAFTGTIPASLNASPHPVRVAFPLVNNPAFAQPFDGLLDDVRIYNRALSDPEIAELYRMNTASSITATGALVAAP